jgi:predicted transcriptional regulator with HTH domain
MIISKKKKQKIAEQILFYLYSTNPKPIFTSYIAEEIARDEEFVKKILLNLKEKKLVIEVKKNSKGYEYIRRSRWKLSNNAYDFYKKSQIN